MKMTCAHCGEEFDKLTKSVNLSSKKGLKAHFCSTSCHGKSLEICNRKDGLQRMIHGILRRTRCNASMRSKPFELTVEDVKSLYTAQNGKCAITGIVFPIISGSATSLYKMSIDRIDNNNGYVVGNVQLVCAGINMLKRTHSSVDVAAFLNAVCASRV